MKSHVENAKEKRMGRWRWREETALKAQNENAGEEGME